LDDGWAASPFAGAISAISQTGNFNDRLAARRTGTSPEQQIQTVLEDPPRSLQFSIRSSTAWRE
jgi:hypothetical protein